MVNGKKYAYTKSGRAAAKAAAKKMNDSRTVAKAKPKKKRTRTA